MRHPHYPGVTELVSPIFKVRISCAPLPRILACRPTIELLKAASLISQSASMMLSSMRLSEILQLAPMEACGPMVEFLIIAVS